MNFHPILFRQTHPSQAAGGNRRGSHRGQALTELAVSMTFLLVLLAGIVDLGRVFFTYISMRDAALEGLAYGTIGSVAVANGQKPANGYCDQVINRAAEAMTDIPATVTVTLYDLTTSPKTAHPCTSGTVMSTQVACFSQEIQIETTYDDYPLIMPFIGTVLGSQSVDLKSTITGTIVGPPCK